MTHSAPPSPTSPRPTYLIGARRIPRPLVSPDHVKGHIRLLRTFHNLRITVEDCKDRRIPDFAVRMGTESRWRWFVHLAVDRFERWVNSLQFVPLEQFVSNHLPPFDVWMVWHAYLLSPCWYTEDCERIAVLQQLRLLNLFVVSSIDIGKVVKLSPSSARVEAWHKRTGTPFNPFEAMVSEEGTYKELECPRCRTKVYVPFIDDTGTGFAEANFSAICPLPGCRLKLTNDNLAVAKFVRDLSEGDYVAGSLYVSSGKRDVRQAKVIKDQLMRSAHFAAPRDSADDSRLARLDWIKSIKENFGYSLERLQKAISNSLANCHEASVTRILGAYTNGSPFSIDLIDAVLRQCHFTEKMEELDWLKSGTFREYKSEILDHSVIRYHAFLDLITTRPNTMPVPTLDVDLVWHTHQLMASRYNVDCEMYVGHYVDHEISVAESHLSSAFDNTCRAWKARYQIPYMQCGCPSPDRFSMKTKLVQIVRQYVCSRPRMQLVLHPDHLPATHPSAHNALITLRTLDSGTFGRDSHYRDNGKQKERPIEDDEQQLFRARSHSPVPSLSRSLNERTFGVKVLRSSPLRRVESDLAMSMNSSARPSYFQAERDVPGIPCSPYYQEMRQLKLELVKADEDLRY